MKLAGKKVVTTNIFLTILNCLFIYGQMPENHLTREKKADSLALIEKHKEAVDIFKSIIDDPEKIPGKNEKLRLEYKIGFSLMHSGQYIQAIPYFRKVIKDKENHLIGDLVNDAMTGLGRTYEYTGKHDSAFFWYMEAYKQVSGSEDTLRMARDIRNMAQLLRVLNQFDEARYYCRKAVELIPGIKDYKVLANIYNETAYLFELNRELDSAIYFYEKLINISVKSGYLKGESVGYSNLASVYEREERFGEAIQYKQKGIKIDLEIDDKYGLMNSYKNLSETYLLAGKNDKALDMLHLSYELCDTSWLPDLSGINLLYYTIYKNEKQFGKALQFYETYITLHDRINQEESKRQVAELLTQYETEKKEQQIQLLNQTNLLKENKIRTQKIIIGTLTLIGLLILITSWLWLRNKNQKLRQMNIELQHLLIREEQQSKTEVKNHTSLDAGEIYKKWGLTSRESEILYYLGRGCSNTIIGEKLFISENTVKFHIKNIYLKLDVKNRIQALLLCTNE